MINNETKDRIYSAIRVEDVVGDYVTLRRRGANYIGLCPFHDERTPSFNVNPARGIYKCFGCGKAGGAVNFVMEIENCTYPEALRKLAAKYHIEVVEEVMSEEQQQRHDERESMFVVNEWAAKWMQDRLWNSEDGRAIGLSYLRSRGLYDETIRTFGLGYDPEKGAQLSKAAMAAGYREEYLVNHPAADQKEPEFSIGTGITGKQDDRVYDRFAGRVIYPFYNISGRVVGFTGRIMSDRKDTGKYVNSPESILYKKRKELFGIYQAKAAISKNDMAYLVEGQMDVISMHQAGIKNVVSSGGTALTEEHVRVIHRFTNNVTVLYDGDSAGVHAALRAIPMFLSQGMQLRLMLFPDGDDPDSFSRKHTAEEFVAYIEEHAENFVSYQKRVLLDPLGDDLTARLNRINEIIDTIAPIADAVTRQLYTQQLAQVLNMEVDVVTRSVESARKKYLYQLKQEEEGQKAREQYAQRLQTQLPQSDVEQAVPVQAVSARTPEQLRMDGILENVIRLIIRHGQEVYEYNPDGTFYPIGLYLTDRLLEDHLQPENVLYQRVIDEYREHFADEGFLPETYFLRHTDPELVALGAQMISDRYVTAKPLPESNDYPKQARRLILELKRELCNQRLKALPGLIASADQEHAMMLQQEMTSMLRERIQLMEALRQL